MNYSTQNDIVLAENAENKIGEADKKYVKNVYK